MSEEFSKCDLHIHTKYSGYTKYMGLTFPDSVEEPKRIMKYAKKKNLNVIAITDHNTIKGGLETKKLEKEYGVEVIVGCEFSTTEGEIIGLFLNEEIPKKLSPEETIDRIHEQGGLAIVPHPYSPICHAIGDKMFDLKVDGVEVFNAYHRDGIVNNIALEKVVSNYHKKPVAFIGSSDAHLAKMVGNGHTIFKGIDSDDLYRAIINKNTSYGGKPTPLIDIILWSYGMVYESEKRILKSFINNNLNISFYKKIMALIGGFVYISTPLPIISGILGNYYLKRKAKSKLKEVGMSIG